MTSAPFDLCFFIEANTNGVNKIVGLVTDDLINSGNEKYQKVEKSATRAFVH